MSDMEDGGRNERSSARERWKVVLFLSRGGRRLCARASMVGEESTAWVCLKGGESAERMVPGPVPRSRWVVLRVGEW